MSPWLTAFGLALFSATAECQFNTSVVNIGLIMTDTGNGLYTNTAGAINLAYNALQRDGYITNITFNISWLLDKNRDPVVTMNESVYLIDVVNCDVLIGPSPSQSAPQVGYFATIRNRPWWSWVVRDPQFRNNSRFPTLVRSMGQYYYMARALAEISVSFNWTSFAYFAYADVSSAVHCNSLYDAINSWFPVFNLSMMYTYSYMILPSWSDMTQQFNIVKYSARIIIICGQPAHIRQMMLVAQSLSMVTPDYAYVTTPDIFNDVVTNGYRMWFANSSTDFIAYQAYQRLYYLAFDYYNLRFNRTYSNLLYAAEQSAPWYFTNLSANAVADAFSPFLYDLIYLYGMTLNKTMAIGGNYRNGVYMNSLVANVSFNGMTGLVRYSMNSIRFTDFYWWCINPTTTAYEPCLRAQTANLQTNNISNLPRLFFSYLICDEHLTRSFETRSMQTIQQMTAINWGTSDGMPPPSTPDCGYFNELCQSQPVSIALIMAIVLPVTLVLTSTGAGLWMIKQQNEKLARQQLWKLNRQDICFKSQRAETSTASTSLSTVGVESKKTDATENSHHSKIGGLHDHKVELGSYQGDTVIAKKIKNLNPNMNASNSLAYLTAMKELNHPNLLQFIGACVDDPLDAFIITPFCQRGSLPDVIRTCANSEQFKLDWSFKTSFIADAAKGLSYLHDSSLKSHGNLKSTNCLVDIRWTVKLADFGLWNLRVRLLDEQAADIESMYRNMFWTAPEILRDFQPKLEGSQAADIYSLAIVMFEVLFEEAPYKNENAQEIIAILRSRKDPPFRPYAENSAVLSEMQGYVNLMRECWNENPSARPSAAKVRSKIRDLAGGREVVLIDEMLQKMEHYTQQLEETVEQRTAQLAQEKTNADLLLYRMLPASIAECLKLGKTVPPESYQCASVLFTDIVRFTVITMHCTPLQIITLLNTLYNEFDAIIRAHDAYKVETIGDAYMIVSGVPIRNGDKHASELADVALQFLSSVLTFKIDHLPNVPLMIRIGISSGQVCSGVIGSLMPHFCLFGDTVNSASRMESHGKPLMIHLSESTKEILSGFGNYVITSRGLTEIKGKGVMETFWLLKKVGYTGLLPTERDFAFDFDKNGLPRRTIVSVKDEHLEKRNDGLTKKIPEIAEVEL